MSVSFPSEREIETETETETEKEADRETEDLWDPIYKQNQKYKIKTE